MKKSCLVLLAHGSPDERWKVPFEKLCESLRAEFGKSRVRLAYMESIPPNLFDAVRSAREDGCEKLLILPLFMSGGGHVERDIPGLVSEAGKRYPNLAINVLPPIGEDPKVFTSMRMVAKDLLDEKKL